MSSAAMQLKMIDSVRGVERILGYTFSDKSIIWEALQAPGSGVYSSGTRPISNKGNKRLALMGDAAAELVLRVYWYEGGSRLVDGDRLRKGMLNNQNLQYICQIYGIDRFINLNPSSHRAAPKTMSDTMEAIFGAISQDGGQDALRIVMTSLGLLA